jgi:fatty acid desaturase
MSATTPDRNAPVPEPGRAPGLPAIEIPTLLLILATDAAWLAVTAAYGRWPTWLVVPVTAVLLTLHSSLQHEILHGHPTRWRAVNRLLGILPLSLWLPYDRYHDLHLTHHINDRLTDPHDDPESCYWDPQEWARLGALERGLVWIQQTLAGRVVVGPYFRIARFLRVELAAAIRGEARQRAVWLEHVALCIPVLLWVRLVCGIPLWLYVVAMAIPGNGILLIRSFAEHRAVPAVRERTAIVEGSWLLGPLFLFNNLHALHHEEPLLPWYAYLARYRATRDRLLAANGGLLYKTYFDVARRYLFRPHDVPAHPMGGVPRRQAPASRPRAARAGAGFEPAAPADQAGRS